MTKLNDEIKEAIGKHLPQQVAGELKKALQDYEEVKKRNNLLVADNRRLVGERDEAIEKREEARGKYFIFEKDKENLKKLQGALEERERLLDTKEMYMELEMARHELATERESRRTLEEFVLNLSKVPVYKKTTLQDRSYVVPPTPGLVDSNGYVTDHPVDGYVETKTDETTEKVETE